jgi:hypothetical protein
MRRLRMRRRAIFAPIRPGPTMPICIFFSLLLGFSSMRLVDDYCRASDVPPTSAEARNAAQPPTTSLDSPRLAKGMF